MSKTKVYVYLRHKIQNQNEKYAKIKIVFFISKI